MGVHDYAPAGINTLLSAGGVRIDSNNEYFEAMNSTAGGPLPGGNFTARNLFRDESIQ